MFNFLKKKVQGGKKDYMLGLILKEDEGAVIIFRIHKTQEEVSVVDEKQFAYTNSWENLVDDIDTNLFELEQRNNIHVEKVVFFLYSHLVDQKTHQVQKAYLSKIKTIVQELELGVEGYAEFHESIAIYLREIEQAPLTAIIIEVDRPVVSLFIYKGGKLSASDSIGRTENIVGDLETLFTRLKSDYLPTRIILYDSTSLSEESTKLITHTWQEGLFMQIPKFEIFTKERINKALTQSFSNRLFGETTFTNQLMGGEEKTTTADDEELNHETESLEVGGFVIGQDVGRQDLAYHQPNPLQSMISSVQLHIRSMFHSFSSVMSSPSNNRITPLLSIIGLMLIFLSCISVLYFLHKATVTVFFKTEPIQKEATIEASTNSASEDKLVITKQNETVEASDTQNTTGSKTIGDKAKGTVTIFNLKAQERILKKGSILKTDGGVSFTLDADTKVASASSSLTPEGNVTIVTGKQKASITASDIGTKSNITKDTKLFIETFSAEDTRAQVDTTFTGGSEKKVQTVSKEDMTKLQAAVEKKIRDKGDEIVRKNAEAQRTITDLTTVTSKKKDFSKELSEETATISLTMQSDVTYYSYDDNQLKKTLSQALKNDIPDSFELPTQNISYSEMKTEKDKKDDSKVTIMLNIKAKPVKKVDIQKLESSIKGKRVSSLQTIVKEKYDAAGYEADIQTPFPPLRSWLPFFSRNLQIHINSL